MSEKAKKFKFPKMTVKVISQEGTCMYKHHEGQELELVNGMAMPAGMCPMAYYAMFPFINVLFFGGSYPFGDDKDAARMLCPDHLNPIVFEVRRTTKS